MAIDKRFLYYTSEEKFLSDKKNGEIDNKSIAFISADGKRAIYTHGKFFAPEAFVVGTQTTSTNTFTGTFNEIDKLYDGLSIKYWLPYNGTSTAATLNLDINGTQTGNIPVYVNGTTRFTTHIEANNIIYLTYRENVGNIAKGWWVSGSNSNNSNTTYTFTSASENDEGGTFKVKPSNGSTQTVSVGIKDLTLQFNSGSVENKDIYTYNGKLDKTINIKSGDNISFGTKDGELTISGSYKTATPGSGGDGLMSGSDKTKLDNISSGAEVNQNSFTNIVIGNTIISAENKTDSLTLEAGENITITPKEDDKKVIISSKDTTYKTATPGNGGDGLMSGSDKTKLDGIEEGANNYTHPTYANKTTGLYKFSVDSTGHVNYTTKISKKDITDLGIASDSVMGPASETENGTKGLVPAPLKGDQDKFLRADGLWVVPTDTEYTHPSYTARTGEPTGNGTPGFGDEFKVSQITSDNLGHVTGAIEKTITIPSTQASTTAAGLMSSDDKTKLNFTNIAFGTCSTAASTAAKIITISSTGNTKWSLTPGSIIVVKFTNTNSASNPTFNVNSTGAKSVWYNTALITSSNLTMAGTANRPMQFMYDGTQYVFVGWSYDTDTNTTYSQATLGQGYGTCSTAASTAAKIVTLSNYSLITGGIVSVKFDNNVPANATLNINSKGAKSIYHRGSAISANVINAGDIATFIYSTNYYLIAIDRATINATTNASGLMSSSDKNKLDGIDVGANNYTHPEHTSADSGLYKVEIDSKGHVISTTEVTKEDIVSLGIPAKDTNTHYSSKNIVTNSATSTTNTTTTLSNGNVYLNSIENNEVTSSHKIIGSGATTVTTDASGNINITSTNTKYNAGNGISIKTSNSKEYINVNLKSIDDKFESDSAEVLETQNRIYPVALDKSGYLAVSVPWEKYTLPKASTSALGGIKIAKDNNKYTIATNTSPAISANVTTLGKYYGVEIDSTGKAYVYVPWENTTYTAENGISLSSDKKFGHTNTKINAKTEFVDTDASIEVSSNNGSFKVTDIKYDAFGHITGSQDRTIEITEAYTGTVTSIKVSAGDGISVTNGTTTNDISNTPITSSGTRKISVISANTSTFGGIKASNVLNTSVTLTSGDGSTASRFYGVQIDKDGKAFVNVPWTDGNTYTSAYCSTAASTAAKTASCTNYVLTSKTYLHITLVYSNSAASALTLNVNSKGAKTIYINGTASSSSNYTLPAGTYIVYYDGSYYHFRTDGVLPGKIVDANTVSGKTISTTISSSSEDTTIPTSKAVYLAIYSGIKANDAMIFKGVINSNSSLPASHKLGDTYRVGTAGTYIGQKCEVGDIIICTTTGSSANNSHWTVIQTNIDGAVVGPAENSNNPDRVAIFDGTTGKVIKNSGFTIGKSVPSNAVFTDTKNTAGSDNTKSRIYLIGTTEQTTNLGSAVTYSNSNVYAEGDYLYSNNLKVSTEDHSHPYIPLSGGNITGSIKANGSSSFCPFIYNFTSGSTTGWARNLAGIQVDGKTKFTISAYGNYTSGSDSNGIIYAYIGCNEHTGKNLRITSSDIKWGDNLLLHAGNYTDYTYSSSTSRTANTVLAAPNGKDGAAVFRKLVGSDLPLPTKTTLGGIKASNVLTTEVTLTSTDGSTASRYYGVQIDKNGKAFVNVPWEKGTNTDITVKQTEKSDNKNYYLLASAETSPTSGNAYESIYNTKISINPSTETITAKAFSGNASSATKVKVTTKTTSGTYHPVWTAGTTLNANCDLNGNSNFRYNIVTGTTSVEGTDSIYLGNSTATGKDGNSTGRLLLYSSSSSYHLLIGAATTSSISHTLPTTSGTILNSGTTGITQTITSGVEIASVKINNSSTKIYAPSLSIKDDGSGTFITDIENSNYSITVTRSSKKGSTTKPVYFNDSGVLSECSSYAGGSLVKLNGSSEGSSGTSVSFYAPVASGNAGQVLMSGGANKIPTWGDFGGKVESTTASITVSTSWGTLLSASSLSTLCNSTSGTYVIQVSGSKIGMNSGIFSWSSGGATEDEILLHRCGASTNIYLRLKNSALQIAGGGAISTAFTATIKVRRLI